MELYIGQILQFAGNFEPRGWAYCDGRMLPIAQWQTLFSILNITYGGDGRTTFALPNLNKDLAPNQPKFIICIDGNYPPRP